MKFNSVINFFYLNRKIQQLFCMHAYREAKRDDGCYIVCIRCLKNRDPESTW